MENCGRADSLQNAKQGCPTVFYFLYEIFGLFEGAFIGLENEKTV
jgi:hypothetical protein